tara:strand:+ start:17324 stop:18241 length:918 start_codon:yes stop_codon:yes gene_type:complete
MNEKKDNTTLQYISVFAMIGIFVFLFVAPTTKKSIALAPDEVSASVLLATLPTPIQDTIEITAGAAYVIDTTNDLVLFEKNADAQLPLASVTKVAVALLAHTYLSDTEYIYLSASAIATEGESYLNVGDVWNTQDLIDFMLITSSNDAAVALAEAIEDVSKASIDVLLNELAQDIGLSQTYFLNATGLDENLALSGSYGSAKDMAMLFSYIYDTAPQVLEASSVPQATFYNTSGIAYEAENTNTVLGDLPGLLFSKTGFTDLAGGNLVVLMETEPGHPIIISVLNSTPEGRFEDTVQIVRSLMRN